MPQASPLPITPPPGVVTTETDRAASGRWVDADKVRFVGKKLEKVGGCTRLYDEQTDGTPRTSHAWRASGANKMLGVGTYKKLYVYDDNDGQTDITPLRSSGTLSVNPFTITLGLSIVRVHHVGHGVSPEGVVIFSGSGAVSIFDMNATWSVHSVTDTDNYLIQLPSASPTSGSGGGAAVAYQYEVSLGSELGAFGLGWGVGRWGIGTWGTPRESSTIYLEPRIWSLDHFGKYLIASYNGGTIFTFDPTVPQPWPRAQVIAGAPTDCRAVFVSAERFVVALCEDMRLRWSSQGDYTIWTPAATNTAEERTLTEGTKLITGRVLSPKLNLIWTDAALHTMRWTGGKYVHDTALVGTDCGIVGPNAAVTVNGAAYWMGSSTFYMYDGAVREIPNVGDIRSEVFDDLNTASAYQCAAIYNPKFDEVWFFYTVVGQSNPTKYVIYNIKDQCWTPGTWGRASGTHFTQEDTRPIFAGTDGYIYQHENTANDNGAAIAWHATLAAFALDNGFRSMETEGIETDFKDQVGDISLILTMYDRLRDAALETETHTVGATDALIDYHASGRYLGLTVSGNALGQEFRLGVPQLFVKPTGSRR